MAAVINSICQPHQILSKGVELPRQPPTHPEETEEELTETQEMQEEGAGSERLGEGHPQEQRLQKEESGETSPPSERLLTPLKGESTESDLEEEDDEDEAIELRECDEEGVPYGQVNTAFFKRHFAFNFTLIERETCRAIHVFNTKKTFCKKIREPIRGANCLFINHEFCLSL